MGIEGEVQLEEDANRGGAQGRGSSEEPKGMRASTAAANETIKLSEGSPEEKAHPLPLPLPPPPIESDSEKERETPSDDQEITEGVAIARGAAAGPGAGGESDSESEPELVPETLTEAPLIELEERVEQAPLINNSDVVVINVNSPRKLEKTDKATINEPNAANAANREINELTAIKEVPLNLQLNDCLGKEETLPLSLPLPLPLSQPLHQETRLNEGLNQTKGAEEPSSDQKDEKAQKKGEEEEDKLSSSDKSLDANEGDSERVKVPLLSKLKLWPKKGYEKAKREQKEQVIEVVESTSSRKESSESSVAGTSETTTTDVTIPIFEEKRGKGGKEGKEVDKLVPTDRMFRVRSPLFKYLFSFSIAASVLALLTCAAMFIFPETFDVQYLKLISKYQNNHHQQARVQGPHVTTDCGLIEGKLEESVAVFRGLPYARPPTGQNRWLPPQEAVCDPNGTLTALELKSFCYQKPVEGFNISFSEDCLYLNIWVPFWGKEKAEGLPVLVYIPGDALTGYTSMDINSIPSGSHLAKKYGVLFVTFGYRVGAFGFMALEPLASRDADHPISGNYGLIDQLAALKYVQRHIKSFGGDPEKVNVISHGSGATSVLALTSNPEAAQLMSKLWLSSPSPRFSNKSMDDVYQYNAEFISAIGCKSPSINETDPSESTTGSSPAANSDVLDCLLSASSERVLNATPQGWFLTPFNQMPTDEEHYSSPVIVIDGKTVREDPMKLLGDTNLTIVFGVNAQETGAEVKTPALASQWNYQDLVDHIQQSLSSIDQKVTEAVVNYYLNIYNTSNDIMTIETMYHTMVSDVRMICPLSRALTKSVLSSNGSRDRIYSYLVEYRPSQPIRFGRSGNIKAQSNSGMAVHGFDILAIFDLLTNWFIANPTDADYSYVQLLQDQFRDFLHSSNGIDFSPLGSHFLNVISVNGTKQSEPFPYKNCAQLWDHFDYFYERFSRIN